MCFSCSDFPKKNQSRTARSGCLNKPLRVIEHGILPRRLEWNRFEAGCPITGWDTGLILEADKLCFLPLLFSDTFLFGGFFLTARTSWTDSDCLLQHLNAVSLDWCSVAFANSRLLRRLPLDNLAR